MPNARSSEVALAVAVSELPDAYSEVEPEAEAEAEPAESVEESIETQVSVRDEKEHRRRRMKVAEEARKRAKAEAEERRRREKVEEEERRKAEIEERRRKKVEDEERRKREKMEEEERRKAEAEERRKKAIEEEERRKREKIAEEERRKAEEEARRKAKVDEEERRKAEIEERRRKKIEDEERRKREKVEEEERRKAEAEEKRKAEEEQRARVKAEAEERKRNIEIERLRAKLEEEQRRMNEVEAKKKEEERKRMEAEQKRKAEEERRKTLEEERKKAKLEEEERRVADVEAKRQAKLAEEEERRRVKAEVEERRKTLEEEKRISKVEAEERKKAEVEEKRKSKIDAEERRKIEEGARKEEERVKEAKRRESKDERRQSKDERRQSKDERRQSKDEGRSIVPDAATLEEPNESLTSVDWAVIDDNIIPVAPTRPSMHSHNSSSGEAFLIALANLGVDAHPYGAQNDPKSMSASTLPSKSKSKPDLTSSPSQKRKSNKLQKKRTNSVSGADAMPLQGRIEMQLVRVLQEVVADESVQPESDDIRLALVSSLGDAREVKGPAAPLPPAVPSLPPASPSLPVDTPPAALAIVDVQTKITRDPQPAHIDDDTGLGDVLLGVYVPKVFEPRPISASSASSVDWHRLSREVVGYTPPELEENGVLWHNVGVVPSANSNDHVSAPAEINVERVVEPEAVVTGAAFTSHLVTTNANEVFETAPAPTGVPTALASPITAVPVRAKARTLHRWEVVTPLGVVVPASEGDDGDEDDWVDEPDEMLVEPYNGPAAAEAHNKSDRAGPLPTAAEEAEADGPIEEGVEEDEPDHDHIPDSDSFFTPHDDSGTPDFTSEWADPALQQQQHKAELSAVLEEDEPDEDEDDEEDEGVLGGLQFEDASEVFEDVEEGVEGAEYDENENDAAGGVVVVVEEVIPDAESDVEVVRLQPIDEGEQEKADDDDEQRWEEETATEEAVVQIVSRRVEKGKGRMVLVDPEDPNKINSVDVDAEDAGAYAYEEFGVGYEHEHDQDGDDFDPLAIGEDYDHDHDREPELIDPNLRPLPISGPLSTMTLRKHPSGLHLLEEGSDVDAPRKASRRSLIKARSRSGTDLGKNGSRGKVNKTSGGSKSKKGTPHQFQPGSKKPSITSLRPPRRSLWSTVRARLSFLSLGSAPEPVSYQQHPPPSSTKPTLTRSLSKSLGLKARKRLSSELRTPNKLVLGRHFSGKHIPRYPSRLDGVRRVEKEGKVVKYK